LFSPNLQGEIKNFEGYTYIEIPTKMVSLGGSFIDEIMTTLTALKKRGLLNAEGGVHMYYAKKSNLIVI